jgi:hypothetical protein
MTLVFIVADDGAILELTPSGIPIVCDRPSDGPGAAGTCGLRRASRQMRALMVFIRDVLAIYALMEYARTEKGKGVANARE